MLISIENDASSRPAPAVRTSYIAALLHSHLIKG